MNHELNSSELGLLEQMVTITASDMRLALSENQASTNRPDLWILIWPLEIRIAVRVEGSHASDINVGEP